MKTNTRPLLPLGWLLDGLAVALYALTVASLAGLGDTDAGFLVALGWMAFGAVWLGRVLKVCVRYFYPPSPSREEGSRWKHFGLWPLLVLTLLGLSLTDWPQRLVFGLHRPALEQFARDALASKPRTFTRTFERSAPRQRVGLYSIWRVERVPRGIRFVTRDESFLGREYSGLVFYLGGVDSDSTFPSEPHSNAYQGRRLDEHWAVWKISYYDD